MGKDKPKPPAPQFPYADATQVDLGDDLIERTRIAHERKTSKPSTASPPPAPSSSSPSSSVQDQIDNARIYQTEGMIEEAKKILRKLLISDPANASAKEMLKSIQEQELKRLLDGRGLSSITPPPLKKVRDEGPTGPDEVILELDRDLNLGVIAGDAGRIPNDGELNHFLEDMEMALYGSEGKDRIDLGIAYLEMDSPEVAIHQFKAARRIFEGQEKADPLQMRSSIALLAQAYLAARKPLEAYLVLQEAIHDGESDVEFCYLMGRACESLRKRDEALFWFAKTKEIGGSYRDVEERLRRK